MTITLHRVQRAVADYYGVTMAQLKGRTVYKSITKARSVAIYLSRTMTGETLAGIGAGFSRDHSSVMAAVKRIERVLTTDIALKSEVDAIRAQLRMPEQMMDAALAGTLPTPAVNIRQCPTCGQTVQDAAEKQRVAATLRMGMAAIEQGVKMLEHS